MEINKIYCMDCLEGLRLLPDQSVKLFVADPPYFMGLTHNGQHGQFNDLAVARPFFRELARQMLRTMTPAGEFYCFMDWRGTPFYYPIFAEYLPVKNCIVWDKGCGPGNFYNSSHEFILYGCMDPQTKKHDRNVWRIRGFTSGSIQIDGPKIHPSQKPVDLMQKIITDASVPGDLVCDPFGGAATTAIAAAKTGRNFVVFEIAESYAEISRQRVASAFPAIDPWPTGEAPSPEKAAGAGL